MADIFEVRTIIAEKIIDGNSYFRVVWKHTITKNLTAYKKYKEEVQELTKMQDEYVICWKDSWMSFEQLHEDCDEILGAYLLLKLRNYRI